MIGWRGVVTQEVKQIWKRTVLASQTNHSILKIIYTTCRAVLERWIWCWCALMLKFASYSVDKAVYLSIVLLYKTHATVFVVSQCVCAGNTYLNDNNTQQYNVHPVPSAHAVHSAIQKINGVLVCIEVKNGTYLCMQFTLHVGLSLC